MMQKAKTKLVDPSGGFGTSSQEMYAPVVTERPGLPIYLSLKVPTQVLRVHVRTVCFKRNLLRVFT